MKVRIKAYKQRVFNVLHEWESTYSVSANENDQIGFLVMKEDCEIMKEKFQPESGMVFELTDGRCGIFIQFTERLVMLVQGDNGEVNFEYYGIYDPKIGVETFGWSMNAVRFTKIIRLKSYQENLLIPCNLKVALTRGTVAWERKPETVQVTLGTGLYVLVSKDNLIMNGQKIATSDLETILSLHKGLQ